LTYWDKEHKRSIIDY